MSKQQIKPLNLKRGLLLIEGKKSVIHSSAWFCPYVSNQARFTGTKKCGVYLIKSKQTKKILYVGFSKSDLKKTLYRHFQSWDDPSQKRATYTNRSMYLVKVITCSCFAAPILEKALIKKHSPRDNTLKYKGGGLFSKPIKKLPTTFNKTNPKKSDFVPF